MLLVPMFAGLSPWKAKGALPRVQWFFYGIFLLVIIGMRHEVGGDWKNYIENYTWLQETSLFDLMTIKSLSADIGFNVIYWFSIKFFDGIYTANLICAAIFIAGLLRVCKNMPIPWLALSVAIPYLVVVVAMGYTRQAAAIGFVMWGLIDIMNGKPMRFYGMILLGTLFHRTALFMLPVGFLYVNSIRNFKDILIFILFFAIAFVAFLAEHFANLMQYYVTDTQGMESSGAFIRVMMNVIAALVFLNFRKAWEERYSDARLWFIFCVISIIMLPLALVISTTIDRMALYFLPMQLVIFSRVPLLIGSTYNRTLFVLVVLLFYITTLFVWLNFGNFSSHWLPYQNILIQ